MNTITVDGGAKRQFALPAAIVLGAYAALFFGFVSHPPISLLNPPRIHPKEYEPIVITPPEEIVVQKSGDPAPHSLSQPQDIQDPVSPKPFDTQEITIPSEPYPVSPTVPIIGPSLPGNPGQPIGSEGQPFTPEMLDHTPQATAQPQPAYPWDAKSKDLSGDVVVTFVVDESGHVLNPRVVSSSDPVFEEPTLRAIEQWRFAPGTLHGVPVRFRMSVPVAFRLDR
jgi:protein TonB